VDPVEKKPLFHYMPGSLTYSIATVGCNFHCGFCQNYSISQAGVDIPGLEVSPEMVVETALAKGCGSIAYTYTEPTIFGEYAVDCMTLAKEEGLGSVFVSNGFSSPEALEVFCGLVDAVNVDLKCFSDETYRSVCGGRLEPVLNSIRTYRDAGVWVEVTTLLIPGVNDSESELREIAGFLAGLDKSIPWHISRFHPDYKMREGGSTPIERLHEAMRIGREAGLKYVYAGNIPHEDGENTYCSNCGHKVVGRQGFSIQELDLKEGLCSKCGEPVAGVF
jgi:pyruvate formate lyase activating enzyme